MVTTSWKCLSKHPTQKCQTTCCSQTACRWTQKATQKGWEISPRIFQLSCQCHWQWIRWKGLRVSVGMLWWKSLVSPSPSTERKLVFCVLLWRRIQESIPKQSALSGTKPDNLFVRSFDMIQTRTCSYHGWCTINISSSQSGWGTSGFWDFCGGQKHMCRSTAWLPIYLVPYHLLFVPVMLYEKLLRITTNFFPADITETVTRNFYVDVLLKSLPCEEDAILIVKNLTAICEFSISQSGSATGVQCC